VIANFPRRASDDELCLAFDACEEGAVQRCAVFRDVVGNARYAFVEFAGPEAAERALSDCQRGLVVLEDEQQRAWHFQASRSRRAIVGQKNSSAARRRRRRRGPQVCLACPRSEVTEVLEIEAWYQAKMGSNDSVHSTEQSALSLAVGTSRSGAATPSNMLVGANVHGQGRW